MHILVTNDDGVQFPGLLALAKAMQPLGKVSILAPDRNWSASGHVKTLDRPLRVKEISLNGGLSALACDGAPSDCVALALLGLLEPIDLVVSGINPHANLGHDITYSGTVTAAMEAAIGGVRGLAFSLDTPENSRTAIQYDEAARMAAPHVQIALTKNLPHEILINVNLPYRKLEEIKGYRITRTGQRIYRDELVRRADPRGRPYYWIGGDVPTGKGEESTDIGALAAGYVSITPIQLDLTAHPWLEAIASWNWPLSNSTSGKETQA